MLTPEGNLDIFAWKPSDMTGIQLAKSDEEKTNFHTSQEVYWYTKMPFGLKNDAATYQRLVDKAFDSQIGQNIEVYIDDLVIKSHAEVEMLRYIGETFYIGSRTSLQATKAALVEITPAGSTQTKEGADCIPIRLLRAISAVLMTERGMVQTSVYFISRVLQGPKLNYTLMEKLVLSLVFAAKRLRRTSVKGQVLADFLAEMPDEIPPDASVVETQQEPWTLFTDGSSSSNNEAKYEALIAGLRIAAQMGVQNVYPLTPITAPWPFYKWGIDIAGPFPEAPAVIPAEIRMPTYRTAAVDVVHNDEELQLNLDLLEERRERAAIREAKNDKREARTKVGRTLRGKEALGDGAYKLRSMDETVLPRT
nr:hypothetical protein [Tanacetum cinerariifolium]